MVKETENREVWALLEARQFVWELSQYEIWISHTNIESSTEFQVSSTNKIFFPYMVMSNLPQSLSTNCKEKSNMRA